MNDELLHTALYKPKRVLGVFGLTMITTSVIASVNSAPEMAHYGTSLITIYVAVAIVFLIPTALISAELATGWPEDGGVYAWVREAFGERLGFVAVFVQWANAVLWFPAIMMLAVTAVLHAIGQAALLDSKWFVYACIVVGFWLLTAVNLMGMLAAEWMASIGTILGRFVPIGFMAVLSIVWVTSGNASAIEFSAAALVPNFEDYGDWAFLVGAFTTFVGVETSASNAASAKDPRRDYPRAIILSAILSFVLVTVAALAIAVVIPKNQISMADVMDSVATVLHKLEIDWLVPIIAGVFALGLLAEVNSWITAPSRGLLVAARAGNLPPVLHKVTHTGVQWRVLVLQGIFVSIFALCIPLMGKAGFWITMSLPTQIYLMMYFAMFAAGVRLRYSQPHVHRHYRVPFGNVGIWTLAVLGIVGGVAAIGVGFVPIGAVTPDQYGPYLTTLIGGWIVVLCIPFVIFRFRGAHWQEAEVAAPSAAEPSIMDPAIRDSADPRR